jgi:hypothetical protein
MANFYTWATTGSGDWSTASNWFDVTTGTPAAASPGASDTAEIDNAGTVAITVTGPADVAGLSVTGQVTLAGSYDIGAFALGGQPVPTPSFSQSMTSTIVLAGTFNAQSLSVGELSINAGFYTTPVIAAGLIEVGAGALLSAGTVALNAGDLQVDGGAATIGSGLTLGSVIFPIPVGSGFVLAPGSLDVTNHGSVQLGGLSIVDGGVSLDATSTLEIGAAGTATAGTITIDPGAVLFEGDTSGYVSQSLHAAETADIAAPVLNNGIIDSDMNLSGVINNGTINAQNGTLSFISGDGLVQINNGGTSGPGDIDYSGTIVVALGSGVPIDTADTPILANFGTNDTGETIVLQGISADAATYTVNGLQLGTLALYDGTVQVASLTMQGNYDGNAFSVAPDGSDSIVTLNTAAAVANSYSWVATGSGDWSTAGNWFDVTTGSPAAVAPGSGDTAEIDNTGTGTFTVTGPANVADLSVSGNVTLAGNYTVGTFVLAIPPNTVNDPEPPLGGLTPTFISDVALLGRFDVNSVTIGFSTLVYPFLTQNVFDTGVVSVGLGSMLSAGSVLLNSGSLLVDGGSVDIGGALTLGTLFIHEAGLAQNPVASGTLDVVDGARVNLGNLSVAYGDVSLDATSTLEVGAAGTAAAGTITVDPAGFLDLGHLGSLSAGGGSAIAPPVLNNGTIHAAVDLSNTVNNGTILIGDLGHNDVTLSAISGNGQIDFYGNGGYSLGGGTIGPAVSGTLNFDSNFVETITFALGAGVPVNGADTPRIANFTIDPGADTYGVSDSMTLQGITADSATYTATGPGIGTLTLEDGTTLVASLTMLGTYAPDAFSVTPGSGGSVVTLNVPCFAAGTRIATPRGEVAVEALCPGDAVRLASGDTAPIVWVGRRHVDCRSHPKPDEVWPVRIRRDTFGVGVPCRDLFLSPDHAIFAEAVLIPIKYLINGDTIRQVKRKSVTYFHLELPAHDVLLADGLAAESYLDTGDRRGFANGGRVVSLFPSFSSLTREAYGYAPLVVTGPPLDAVRRQIEIQGKRAGAVRARQKRRKLG